MAYTDNKKWHPENENVHAVFLKDIESANIPKLLKNEKCLKDYVVVYKNIGENMMFRCGNFYPFNDIILIEKKVIQDSLLKKYENE